MLPWTIYLYPWLSYTIMMVQPRSLPDILRQRYEAPKLVNNWCVQQVARALIVLEYFRSLINENFSAPTVLDLRLSDPDFSSVK